jgi:phage shock protein B
MWSAIALIVIAGCVLEAYRSKHKHAGNADNDRLADLEAKIDRLDNELRDRVETLERIVTDRSSNLKREFDYLDKAS